MGSLRGVTIVTNVPYGVQSQQRGRSSEEETQALYRRFGRWLVHNKDLANVFVVARKTDPRSKSNFMRASGLHWDTELDFNNGGLNVFLLRLNREKQ